MKIKSMLPIMGACVLMLSAVGCSSSTPEKEEFDAAAYSTAYLDSIYKGESASYAELSGQEETAVTSTYEDNLSKWVSSVLGSNTEAPGSEIVPPDLNQSYTDLWKSILAGFKYEVKDAKKDGDNYTVTISAQKMELYTQAEAIIAQMGNDIYSGADVSAENPTTAYAQAMLGIYQEAFDNVTYTDPEELTVTLLASDDDSWSVSEEDIAVLDSKLIDSDVAVDGLTSESPEDIQTEATPNQVYPENLGEATSYQVGDKVSLLQDGQEVASFSIDSVEVTDERSEYDPSNPEKVVVITYTYQNLALEEPILYDQMSFQLLDGETVCDPYYLQSLISPNISEVGGDPITASIAYGVSASCQEVIVYVDGVQIDQPFQVPVSFS